MGCRERAGADQWLGSPRGRRAIGLPFRLRPLCARRSTRRFSRAKTDQFSLPRKSCQSLHYRPRFVTSIGKRCRHRHAQLRDLRHGFELYPPFQKPDIPCKVVGTIKEFGVDSTDPEDWTFPSRYKIKRELVRSMAPNVLFAHCAMLQAIEDAHLTEADISNPQTGLYAASGGSPYLTHYHHERLLKVGVMRCSPLGIVASIVGTLNFNLTAAFKVQGASCGFSSACASSAHALGYAFDDLVLGRRQRMFIVGAGQQPRRDPPVRRHAHALASDRPASRAPFDAAATVRRHRRRRSCSCSKPGKVSRRGATPYASAGRARPTASRAISHRMGGSAASIVALRRADHAGRGRLNQRPPPHPHRRRIQARLRPCSKSGARRGEQHQGAHHFDLSSPAP